LQMQSVLSGVGVSTTYMGGPEVAQTLVF